MVSARLALECLRLVLLPARPSQHGPDVSPPQMRPGRPMRAPSCGMITAMDMVEIAKGLPAYLKQVARQNDDSLMLVNRGMSRSDGAARHGDFPLLGGAGAEKLIHARIMANKLGDRAGRRLSSTRRASTDKARSKWAKMAASDMDEGTAYRNFSRE